MTIDWVAFTPWTSLLGGALVGLGVVGLLLSTARMAGISGIVSGVLHRSFGDKYWRVAFVLGMLAAPLVYSLAAPLPLLHFGDSWWMLVAGGLLVGFGSRLGPGCTSGHALCGLSLFSPRALAATLTFMATGFATVYLLRHVAWG